MSNHAKHPRRFDADWRADVDTWIYSGPSRRLRKAYAAVAVIEREMEKVRRSNPVPDHAPSSCRIISRRLRELSVEHFRWFKRIANLIGDD